MTARLVMTQAEVEGDRERWLAERRSGVTASEIAAVLGISPPEWGSAFSLYHDKLLGETEFDNDTLALGRYLEEYVAQRFAALHPELYVLPGGLYRSAERPWQMATFDRLAWDAGVQPSLVELDAGTMPAGALAPVQCKTAGSQEEWGSDPADGIIPPHYRAQCLYEMDVLGTYIGFLVVLFLFNRKVRVYALERDGEAEADIAFMRAQAEAFLLRIRDRQPPPVDWTPATTRALKRLHPDLEDRQVVIPKSLAYQYEAAIRAEREAERRKGLAVNRIMDRLGNASAATVRGSLYPVAQRRKYSEKRVSATLLRREYPDVASACEVETPKDGLWPGKWVREMERNRE